MPVGIGIGRGDALRPAVTRTSRFSGPEGFHPGALWLATAVPVAATLLLLVRLAA
ncbi:hypothetical protein [Methylobacterium radiotolerans]|jgi:hypothetical protein|uniref:Uncharacterized protein n=1 Tax=Methylobacterium radiotolerans (strain ATCC 27329 / DSM 1819 / JCM 2831 / NBRC 15690 / NCIMB 10815 / 0-1) TaxID=426355 RepID=B1LVY3_METRJ|nr:hypothetical protein [Methylobacterium radiotolerans]ACB25633.1 hypothetical protein Mrad2831_3657 [Methylobacterium radiotolerans JCM 2831]KZB98819.1 hypothetical protein AU375_04983 [Methylobacterium radiotolerans]MBY0255141.1 hypothetical protein [Methylobacterium organophilum]GEM97202.1 hypothetical protein MRA01_17420 [Methylobacterium radiotolerans]